MKPRTPAPWSWKDWAALGARLAAGAVLAASGVHKAAAPATEFAAVIEAYRLLPEGLILPFARLLPWAEALVGAALLGGYLTRKAAASACVLFLLFIGALGSTLLRGIDLASCGCFGEGVHLTQPQAIGLDAVLLLLALFLYKNPRAPLSLDAWVDRGK